MLISPAYAQAAGGAPGGFDLIAFLPLILIFVVFYFLLIRPQQKRMKEHAEMQNKIRRNDKIVTAGGLLATVTKAADGEDSITVEIAEGVRVQMRRAMIHEVVAKTEPVAAKADKADKDDKKSDKS